MQKSLEPFVIGSNPGFACKNTGGLCRINRLHLKQRHQKTRRKLDSAPFHDKF